MARPAAELACTVRNLSLAEAGVLGVGERIAAPLDEPAHALHPGGDEHVALARLDGVERHPGRLQRRRAVPGHRRAGQVIVSEQHRDHAGHVEALLAAGQPAAQHEVLDVARIQLRYLGQGRSHQLRSQVIRADAGQRALERPANRRPRGGDDHCFGHGTGLLGIGFPPDYSPGRCARKDIHAGT